MCGSETFLSSLLIRHAVLNSGTGKGVKFSELLPAKMRWLLRHEQATQAEWDASFDAL